MLHDVSFALAAGECAGLVGVSGCGKSTTARIIAGLTSADSGIVRIGTATFDAAQAGRCAAERFQYLQMIFQLPEASFDPRRTLGWSIAEPLRVRGLVASERRARVEELLSLVELPQELAAHHPFEVSGGQCQRAAIARALAAEPRILLCDEVTSALDVTLQKKMVALLRRLTKERGIACLFITHDLPLLSGIADRILVMDAGSIVEDAPAHQLLSAPSSPAAKQLLSVDFFQMKAHHACRARAAAQGRRRAAHEGSSW